MRKHRCNYRTSDGLVDYSFSIEESPDGQWRIYIQNQPSYRNREKGGSVTHRLSESQRLYVCWTKPLHSLAEAKKVAQLWAEKTQDYIRTGRKF